MDDEIILNKELLRAIGAETRIHIMKALSERQKMQSELASELRLSSPTVLEHLDQLVGANLVEKVDEGRKWKYYKLTSLGKKLISSSKNKTSISAFIVLGILLVLAVGWLYLFNPFGNGMLGVGSDIASAPQLDTQLEKTISEKPDTRTGSAQESGISGTSDPYENGNKITVIMNHDDYQSTLLNTTVNGTNLTNETMITE
ncbi:MAG: winged helix-turn-helix domain-containing protein [Candidatus Micrarchaeota archaeon]